ncbi:uncharacterized protein [Aegilops tauschii subsp. strangulata]|uniref:Uncharacterized protein n=2 Tax=Aegilops tauschii subsp. strangulata TaxID=200361 RepID=A0A453T9T0_AEGTS|nr:uncharacterized protein LOC109752367 isoform X3 [Aegilops tauschii subsp. strangulata]
MNCPEMANSHDEPEKKLQDSNGTPMCDLRDELEKKLQDSNGTPMCLRLEFLKAITCNFSTESELGRGGYGVVYKGVLQSGKIIAVKKLFEIHLLDDKTFQNEVTYLMETRHQNIVQFIGYCAESTFELMKQPNGNFIWAEIPKRLLCFEYVCNKSLDKYISDESSGLEWNIRYKLIKGICSGLQFLHDKCRIVHLDLKPENILMDSMMMPKITDFGLSRIFGEQQTRIVTAKPAGTRGYMAPEYLLQGVVSSKADIFSLGVIVIEIITGRRDYPLFQQDSPHSTATSCQHFVEKVLTSWRKKFKSASKYISMEKYSQQVELCIVIALACVDPVMEKRPTAKDIVQVLNAADQMEAGEELPFEMQCKDRLLVLHTTISKELIPHSNSEDMFGKETDGKVGDVKKQQEGWSPTTPLSESSTCTQNHKQAMKESSTPEQANEKTNEMEAHEELTSNTLYTDKLLVQNTACKDLTPLSVTEDMFNYRIDGKVVDETTCEGFSPAPLLELSTNNQNYQEEEKESSKPQVASGTTPKIIAICSKLLDVHPPELNFPVEPNKLVTCSLHLTNRNNNQVVFRLMEKRYNWMCFLKLPLYGIVPPRSTYTLVVTTDKRGSLPTEREVDLILQTVISNEYITPYKRGHEWDNYFEKAKKVEKAVHTVPLKAIYSQKGKMSCEVEACEELPLDMQCTDKLVVNTLTNDLAPHSELVDEVKSDRGLSPTHLWESSIHNQNCLEGAQSAHDITTEIEMEAPEELPSDMQYTDKLLVLNTTKCKDLTMPSVTEDLFKNEIDGKVVDETSSQLSRKTCSRTHLLESSTVSQNYQEEVKATSEPQLASDTTAEVEACEEFPLDRQCTNKLVVSTASKDLAPHSVTEDLFINKTDGKLVGEVTSDEVVGAPGLRRRVRVCPLPNNQQVQRHQAPSSPVAPVLLCESNIGNGNYPEGAKDSNETHSAHDTTTETEVIPGSSTILDVCPLELHFSFEPNKLIPCSLELTNNTVENLVFVLKEKSDNKSSFLCLPLYGIVAPRSTYTLVVTINKHKNLPEERTIDLILQSSTIGDDSLCSDAKYICKERFKDVNELGNTVHKVSLKAVCASQGETTFEHATLPLIKIISVEDTDSLHSMDANQTEPLIVTGSFGYVHMQNYGLQESVGSVEASSSQIVCVKFITRKRWFLAGSSDGFVHVYEYENKMEKITSFKAHNLGVRSLAIHPTQPYVLSGSRARIRLWDWDWKCIRTFEEHWGYVCGVTFNPEDPNSFVSFTDSLKDHTIQVWSLDSTKYKYSLSGHSHNVRCLDFFTCDSRKYLVTGSLDKTAKIWDMQKNECARTLPHRSAVLSVVSHPNPPVLIAGTEDGHVYLWCSVNFRLKRVLNIHGRERVEGLACLAGSRRVAVAHNDALSVIEIGDEEHGGGEGKSEESVSAADWEILLDTNVESMHARKKEKAKKC